MKTYVYPADAFGCGYYRLIWISRQLQKEGHDIEIVMPGQGDLRGTMDEKGDTIKVTNPEDADVMVMQRITHRALAQGIPLWREKGIAIVMDIDDDLGAIHPANPAWKVLHPNGGKQEFSWRTAELAARDSTMIAVSTPALAQRYGVHDNAAVLHNYIPQRFLNIPHTDSDIVGWGGSLMSHPDDFDAVGHALQRITDDGAHFRIVGPANDMQKATRITRKENMSATGSIDLKDWPERLAAELGIGIAPLADTRFNAAKSWLKPLEYASLGIPALMSPRAEYAALHRRGIGVLCKKPRDWERECKRLIGSEQARAEISAAGREKASEMTIEKNAWRWAEVWEEALKRQRQ